jgi:hypothetical protein
VTRYLTVATTLAGAADSGQFLVRRSHLLRENPRRAAGIVAGVATWSGLALSAALDQRPGRRTLALATAVVLANGALLAVHLRRARHGPRVLVGPALAAAALGTVLAGRARL